MLVKSQYIYKATTGDGKWANRRKLEISDFPFFSFFFFFFVCTWPHAKPLSFDVIARKRSQKNEQNYFLPRSGCSLSVCVEKKEKREF